jgi:hypothetical protein
VSELIKTENYTIMKRILSLLTLVVASFVLLSSFSLRENPQDPPRGKKKNKHIKLVKVDADGKKTELDTVIENDNVFVWNGDTIGSLGNFEWTMNRMGGIDSLLEDFDFDFDVQVDIDDDGEKKVFVMKSGNKNQPFVFNFNGIDSVMEIKARVLKDVEDNLKDVMIWHDDEEHSFVMPDLPHPPSAPHIMHIKKNKNVIDLSNPGIISFKKKEKRNGREKITIIREKPDENESINEEVIINAPGKGNARFMAKAPEKVHKIEVIEEDGETKIIEGDGKVIKIRKHKDGDAKEMEVKVEIIEEKEKQDNDNN